MRADPVLLLVNRLSEPLECRHRAPPTSGPATPSTGCDHHMLDATTVAARVKNKALSAATRSPWAMSRFRLDWDDIYAQAHLLTLAEAMGRHSLW
jgi:hypothetical protein